MPQGQEAVNALVRHRDPLRSHVQPQPRAGRGDLHDRGGRRRRRDLPAQPDRPERPRSGQGHPRARQRGRALITHRQLAARGSERTGVLVRSPQGCRCVQHGARLSGPSAGPVLLQLLESHEDGREVPSRHVRALHGREARGAGAVDGSVSENGPHGDRSVRAGSDLPRGAVPQVQMPLREALTRWRGVTMKPTERPCGFGGSVRRAPPLLLFINTVMVNRRRERKNTL